MANREGHSTNAQFLELLPVNVEGLTTADEKQVLRNEASMSRASWTGYGNDWNGSGKGRNQNYAWIQKGKQGDHKGKKYTQVVRDHPDI